MHFESVTQAFCIYNCEITFLGINTHTIFNTATSFKKKKKILSGARHKYLAALNKVILGHASSSHSALLFKIKQLGKLPEIAEALYSHQDNKIPSFLQSNFAG